MNVHISKVDGKNNFAVKSRIYNFVISETYESSIANIRTEQ